MNKTGNFKATVTEVEFVEHRFQQNNPGAIEIKLQFESDGGNDVSYMDLSPNYSESPKHAGMRNCDITKNMLISLGVDLNKNPKDLKNLKGQVLDFYGKEGKSGDVYYYVSVYSDTKVKPQIAFDHIAGLFGDGGSSTQGKPPTMKQPKTQEPQAQEEPEWDA